MRSRECMVVQPTENGSFTEPRLAICCNWTKIVKFSIGSGKDLFALCWIWFHWQNAALGE